MPNKGKTEVSSRLQFENNLTNRDTHYHSGNEFIWEFDAMQNVNKRIAIGANGYFLHQLTGDKQNGMTVSGGNFGRDLSIGPQVRLGIAHSVVIFKYYRDTCVQNRPKGNSFWFELGMPIGHRPKANS